MANQMERLETPGLSKHAAGKLGGRVVEGFLLRTQRTNGPQRGLKTFMLQRTLFDIWMFAPGCFPRTRVADRRRRVGREHVSRDSAGSVENVWLCDVHMSTHLMMLAWGRMRTSMNAEQHGYVHRKKHSVLERPPRATEKSGTLLHPILTVTVPCASGNVVVNVPQ